MDAKGFDWRILLLFFLAGLMLLLLVGCGAPGAPGAQDAAPRGWMEVRMEAGAGVADAASFPDPQGGVVWFGPATWFPLSFLGTGADNSGAPTVEFEVAKSHREAFADLTEANTGNRMGVFAGGELVSLPRIVTRMPRTGVLAGSGWDAARCSEVRAALRRQQPPQ